MSSILVGRTRARSQAIQLIYQAQFTQRDVYDLLADGSYVLDDGPLDEYAAQLARGVARSRLSIDRLLASVSKNWNLSRMPLVDRVIMAVAIHEMFDEPEIPVSVAISEAVEIAKVYGTDDSSAFINGILGRIARLAAAHPDVPFARLSEYADESVEQTEAATRRVEEARAAAEAQAADDADDAYDAADDAPASPAGDEALAPDEPAVTSAGEDDAHADR